MEEQDSEGDLPRLGVMWRQEAEKISTGVYRKTTHTQRIICSGTCPTHIAPHKCNVVRILFHRVENHIIDEDRKRVEKEKIRTDLR